jgi:hypothetical protein
VDILFNDRNRQRTKDKRTKKDKKRTKETRMTSFAGADSYCYVDEPGNTTVWEDTLVKHGIINENPEHVQLRQQQQAEERAIEIAKEIIENYNPLDGSTLEEIDQIAEDEEEFANDRKTIEKYREKRLAELKAKQQGAIYTGGYKLIGRGDFVREVTEESKKPGVWVVVHLFAESNPECVALHRAFETLAKKYMAVRFLKIIGHHCIEGYPEENLPTFILYNKGECQHHIIGAKQCNGMFATSDTVEWFLSELGVLTTDLVEDPREQTSLGFQMNKQGASVSPFERRENRRGRMSGQGGNADDLEDY